MADIMYLPVYHTYLETLSGLTDAQFGRVMRAALQYSKDGTISSLEPLESMAFGFLKMDADKAREKYENISERNRINGSKGKSNKNPVEPKKASGPQWPPVGAKQANIKENIKEKEKENTSSNEDVQEKPTATHTFVPPTVEEVKAYCDEKGLDTVDPEYFVEYYSTMIPPWTTKLGKPVRNWKLTVCDWSRHDKQRGITAQQPDTGKGRVTSTNPTPPEQRSFDTDDFFEAALMRTAERYNLDDSYFETTEEEEGDSS